MRWSIISLTGILSKDAGNYSCKAKNVAGDAEATISLSVAGTMSTTLPPVLSGSGTGPTSLGSTFTPATVDMSSSPSAAPTTLPPTPSDKPILTTPPPRAPPKPAKRGNGKRLAADEKSSRKDPSKAVKDLEIVEESVDSAVLLWSVEGLSADTPLTVVYSPYGEEDSKQTLETTAGSGKELLQDLSPGIRYSVCIVAKGSVSGKDPCVDFYTLDNVDDSGQNQLFMIVSAVVCAFILIFIALLIYKILALFCKTPNTPIDEEELEKDSYVKFETISMKHRTLNSHPTELWARRPTQDSERMLLCSRSSIDSQMTYKSDSSRSEYLC